MKNIFKIFIFEIKKLYHNKSMFYSLIVTYILLLLGIGFFSQNIPLNRYGASQETEENIFKEYAAQRDYYKFYYDLICGNEVNIPEGTFLDPYNPSNKDFYYENYLKYDYLIKTHTYLSDYININDLRYNDFKYRKSIYMLNLGEISFYLLLVISVLISVMIVNYEYETGSVKNIMASTIKKKEILGGKFLFLFASLSFVLLSFLVLGLLMGNGSHNFVFIFTGNAIKVVSAFNFFGAKMLSTYIMMIFVSLFTILFASFTKKSVIGVLITVSFGLLSLGLSNIVYNLLGEKQSMYITAIQKYFPIVNIEIMHLDFSNILYFVNNGIYLVLIILLFFLAIRNFRKRDIS